MRERDTRDPRTREARQTVGRDEWPHWTKSRLHTRRTGSIYNHPKRTRPPYYCGLDPRATTYRLGSKTSATSRTRPPDSFRRPGPTTRPRCAWGINPAIPACMEERTGQNNSPDRSAASTKGVKYNTRPRGKGAPETKSGALALECALVVNRSDLLHSDQSGRSSDKHAKHSLVGHSQQPCFFGRMNCSVAKFFFSNKH